VNPPPPSPGALQLKDDMSFLVREDAHFGHSGDAACAPRTSTEKTSEHSSHLYSHIGMGLPPTYQGGHK
jgi:hypothetical protein